MSSHAGTKPQSGMALVLGALGVVYGDIGTSPLYTIRECVSGPHGFGADPPVILGSLSMIFWALVLIISVKYMVFVVRADNRGEGGTLALMSLVTQKYAKTAKKGGIFIAMGIFGTALLYGDGMITPSITVLSAVEGLDVATDMFSGYIQPIAIVILVGIFMLQRHGTARIGTLFGPIIVVWFATLAILGSIAIAQEPHVLLAMNPWYAIKFFMDHGFSSVEILGSVFLAVTGGEALYADMGHFGRRPIRIGWFAMALPALLLNYFGQGAALLTDSANASHPFYALAPDFLLYPLVILATIVAVVASQAVISGAFSLTRQAVALGYLPRMRILHTSSEVIGQIYVPVVNALLMVCTVGLVLGFENSSNLTSAYGVAVSTTMFITTLMLILVMKEHWKWSLNRILLFAIPAFIIDASFWTSTMLKVPHGGWFPLLVGAIIFVVMTTWRRGRSVLYERMQRRTLTLENFVNSVFEQGSKPKRVPGAAIFMSGTPNAAPVVLLHNLKYNKVLHEKTIVLCIVVEEVSHISPEDRVEVTDLGHGFFNIIAHYGFMESPHVFEIIELAAAKGVQFDKRTSGYYLGRETIVIGKGKAMAPWRIMLFATLARLAQGATSFYGIPPNQVVELGVQVEL